MGSSNISDIGKIFVQSQAVKTGVGAAHDDAKIAFTEVIGQMTDFLGDSLAAGAKTATADAKTMSVDMETAGKDYDKYQYREMEIREDTGKNWKEDGQLREELESFEEGVKSVLKEELDVTEEQIAEAMEMLGLTFADLMNPNQLASLVTELTGTTDVSALLCNSEFQTVMQAVNELGEALLQKLGITSEELKQLLADASEAVEELQGMPQQEESMTKKTDVSDAPVIVEQAVSEKDVPVMEEAVADEVLKEQAVKPEESAEESEDTLPEDGQTVPETVDASKKEQQAPADGQGRNNQNPQNMSGTNIATGVGQTEMSAVAGNESTAGFSSQLDVSNIIRQIAEFTRVTVANHATTMEMQLNPENLGKIYLEVTSKGGVVSAHITAQNEVVKEALESQIADLRQNMNQAGVKVDAVEVTVGGHEFEKNLEQNAKQEEHQAEEREKATKQTRHINLNDLDELSGLMTEEEALVAQMMADQGNSVDFTA